MAAKKPRILIAEDEEADIALMKIALRDHGLAEQVVFARNGEEALQALFGYDEAAEIGGPGLILLDMKLPKVSGLEILRRIRADHRLSTVPVVIFSSSLDEKDREQSLTAGANEFLVKPMSFEQFRETLCRTISAYLPV